MKVFICEDDGAILEVMRILLLDLGYDVSTTKNYHLALNALKSFKPELIILDYWLSGSKADKLVHNIRKQESFTDTPIILVSAIDNLEEVGKELAVDAIIKKPFDIVSFQKTVKKFNYAKTNSHNRR